MSGPAAPGPRLVYDADAPGRADAPAPREPRRRPWWIVLVVALAIAAGLEWRRAAALEARVDELSAALAAAEAEIASRSRHLDAIRASLDDVRQRVDGLSALAAQDPTGPAIAPSTQVPAP